MSEFVRVADVAEVPSGKMIMVEEGSITVANVDGRLYAFSNICPHAGGLFGEGWTKNTWIYCPIHGGKWDMETGAALTLICDVPIATFEVRVRGADVEVRRG